MGRPRLSSFTIIGIILLAIGIYGLIPGTRFVFDPGLPAEPGEALYYILVGVLMIVNGCFWMKPPVAEPTKDVGGGPGNDANSPDKAPVAPGSPAAKSGDG